MSLQITISAILLFVLSSPVLAAECGTETLGLTAYFSSRGNQWSLIWTNDGIHKGKANYYDNLKEPYRTNVHNSSGNWRSEKLPQALLKPAKQFNVPFDISQTGDFLIAAIYKNETLGVDYPSQQFAIVNLKKQRIIRTIDTEYKIRSLAWSPDSRYFAVLYEQDVTKQVFKGPLDWLSEHLGHRISYSTFYVTIYHPDGAAVCTEQVVKNKPSAMSYIDWGARYEDRVEDNADSAWVKYVKSNCPVISDRLGGHAFDARRKAEPVNVYMDGLVMADKDADDYSKEFTKKVTIKIYESVYANKSLQTKEQAVKEAVNICIESWLAFDPTGEKQSSASKGKQ